MRAHLTKQEWLVTGLQHARDRYAYLPSFGEDADEIGLEGLEFVSMR